MRGSCSDVMKVLRRVHMVRIFKVVVNLHYRTKCK